MLSINIPNAVLIEGVSKGDKEEVGQFLERYQKCILQRIGSSKTKTYLADLKKVAKSL